MIQSNITDDNVMHLCSTLYDVLEP